MEQPLISVIVPVYRAEATLRRCLDSILSQEYVNFELVAVDDGSPDDSGKILDEYAARDGRVRVIHRENGGVSAARNTGLDAALGAYIAFVDSDDWVEPTFLSAMFEALTEEGADIAACGYVNDEGEKHRVYTVDRPVTFGPVEGLERMCYNDGYYITLWDKLYKKELFDGVRCPEGQLFEDTAIAAPVTDRAKKIVLAAGLGYHYVTKPESITTCRWNPGKLDYIASAETMASYIEKKYPHLKKACDRKRLHAVFSTLMQLVNSGVRDKAVEKDLIGRVKKLRRGVFFDKKAPKRDKAAILSLAAGFPVFAAVWKVYRNHIK